MKGQFRVGGKVLVIGAYTDKGRKQDVGKVLTLERYMKPDERCVFVEVFWLCEGEPGWICSGNIRPFNNSPEGYGLFAQKHLMPLDDPDEEDKEKDLEKPVDTGLAVS